MSEGAPQPIVPFYSQAIKVGNTVYLSGTTGRDLEGRIVGSDPKDQSVRALENMKAVLEAAGTNMENVVKLTVYFSRDPPATTMVLVKGLARRDVLVEFDAIAVCP